MKIKNKGKEKDEYRSQYEIWDTLLFHIGLNFDYVLCDHLSHEDEAF